uniref:Uncharacterized protein n=1 Tax=viral metagenome TaxID=1070528 RepID=A0A6C0K4R4_9ZZZZ
MANPKNKVEWATDAVVIVNMNAVNANIIGNCWIPRNIYSFTPPITLEADSSDILTLPFILGFH